VTLKDAIVRGGKQLLPERFKKQLKVRLGVPDMEASLANMKRNGFNPKTVIDIGAYAGEWTQMCRRLFPDARVLMVEPQAKLRGVLQGMASADARLQFSPVLVGASAQAAVPFYESETASSIFRDPNYREHHEATLPMTTLDAVTRNSGFSAPDFVKLDTQGAELAILEGAAETLRSAEAVLMEVNLLEIYAGAPLLERSVAFMAERGFRVYDICSFIRRPLDNALWQTDVIFVRTSSPLLASQDWGRPQGVRCGRRFWAHRRAVCG